jgi:hypothetical protein
LAQIHESCQTCVDGLKEFFEEQHLEEGVMSMCYSTLQRCQDDLFVPYIDNEKYVEKEFRSLVHAFTLALEPFVTFQQARKTAAKNKGYFKLTAAPLPGTVPAHEQLLALPQDMGVSTELVSRLISIHRESIRRAEKLSHESEWYACGA